MLKKISIKTVSAVIVSAIIITIFSIYVIASSYANPFSDVKEYDWFFDDVMWAYDEGYVKGCGNNKFEPQVNLTQAAMLTILYRVAGEPEFENKVNFGAHYDSTDDDFYKAKNSWFYNPFCWAGTVGIIDAGRAETSSRLLIHANGTPLTRAVLATMICDYVEVLNIELPSENDYKGFDDVKEDMWFYKSVETLYKAGIMVGRSEKSFCPDSYATRAEAASIIERIMTIAPDK